MNVGQRVIVTASRGRTGMLKGECGTITDISNIPKEYQDSQIYFVEFDNTVHNSEWLFAREIGIVTE